MHCMVHIPANAPYENTKNTKAGNCTFKPLMGKAELQKEP